MPAFYKAYILWNTDTMHMHYELKSMVRRRRRATATHTSHSREILSLRVHRSKLRCTFRDGEKYIVVV